MIELSVAEQFEPEKKQCNVSVGWLNLVTWMPEANIAPSQLSKAMIPILGRVFTQLTRSSVAKTSSDKRFRKGSQTRNKSWNLTGLFFPSVTSLCGKISSCPLLSVSDLRGVRQCLGTQGDSHVETESKLFEQFFHARFHFTTTPCTRTTRTLYICTCKVHIHRLCEGHESGRQGGSLSTIGAAEEGNGTHLWIWTGSSQEKRTRTGCTLTHSGN